MNNKNPQYVYGTRNKNWQGPQKAQPNSPHTPPTIPTDFSTQEHLTPQEQLHHHADHLNDTHQGATHIPPAYTAYYADHSIPTTPQGLTKELHDISTSLGYTARYTYDNYTCDNCYDCENGDICRSSAYINPRIDTLHTEKIPGYITTNIHPHISQDTLEAAITYADLNNIDNYTLHINKGYYGEEAYIKLNPENTEDLYNILIQCPNYEDQAKIRRYLKQHNAPITPTLPLDNLKEHLYNTHTYTDQQREDIDNTIYYERTGVHLNIVEIPDNFEQEYLHAIDNISTPPTKEDWEEHPIDGIAVYRNGSLYLIDGFDRYAQLESRTDYGQFLTFYPDSVPDVDDDDW